MYIYIYTHISLYLYILYDSIVIWSPQSLYYSCCFCKFEPLYIINTVITYDDIMFNKNMDIIHKYRLGNFNHKQIFHSRAPPLVFYG